MHMETQEAAAATATKMLLQMRKTLVKKYVFLRRVLNFSVNFLIMNVYKCSKGKTRNDKHRNQAHAVELYIRCRLR